MSKVANYVPNNYFEQVKDNQRRSAEAIDRHIKEMDAHIKYLEDLYPPKKCQIINLTPKYSTSKAI